MIKNKKLDKSISYKDMSIELMMREQDVDGYKENDYPEED